MDAAGGQAMPVGQGAVGPAVGIDVLPQHEVVGVEPDRGVEGVGQGAGRVDVVVVPVGGDDGR